MTTTAAVAAFVPTREFVVDGRPIRVFDELLPNVDEYVRALSRAAFTRTETARPDTREFKHWATEIKLAALQQQPMFDLTSRAVLGFSSPGYGYRPYRAYTNASIFGDMLFSHTDCLPGQDDLTALWFIAEKWELDWGGETIFYDDSDEIACAIALRPGRLVVFDGAIKHVGRPPNRICYTTRFTFAIKFERVAVPAAPGPVE